MLWFCSPFNNLWCTWFTQQPFRSSYRSEHLYLVHSTHMITNAILPLQAVRIICNLNKFNLSKACMQLLLWFVLVIFNTLNRMSTNFRVIDCEEKCHMRIMTTSLRPSLNIHYYWQKQNENVFKSNNKYQTDFVKGTYMYKYTHFWIIQVGWLPFIQAHI